MGRRHVSGKLVGATGAYFTLTSECVDGKKATIKVLAVGPSAGFGLKLTGTYSGIQFEDFDTKLNPGNFNGTFSANQAGATMNMGGPIKPIDYVPPQVGAAGLGASASFIVLGNAYSQGSLGPIDTSPVSTGPTIGRDYSITGSYGTSNVLEVEMNDCECD